MEGEARPTELASPVLLLTFNRPDTTKHVIDALRAVKPSKVFAFCDGPRLGVAGDDDKVAATRLVIEEGIDWPATVKTFYPEENRGIVHGPPDAIDWFFSEVTEGIILEDDCVPHPDFFN